MALIRRGARLMSIRTTRFIKLNERNKMNITINEINPTIGYSCFSQLHKRRNNKNLQYEYDEKGSTLLRTKEKNFSQEPGESKTPMITSGMSHADIKRILIHKNRDNLFCKDESFALRLLESCRDMLPDADLETRQELIDDIWHTIEDLGLDLTADHYNVLLTIYAQNSHQFNAQEFLKTMKITPDKDTYRLLLDAIAETGDYAQVLTVIAKIKDMGYPINEATFNSLILSYSINSDVEGARSVIDTMQAARIELNSSSYCALSRGFAARGDLANLKKTLGIGNLNTKQFMSVLKSLSISGNGKYIPEVTNLLPNRVDIKSNDCVYTIVELTHLGKAQDAFEVVNASPFHDIPIDSSTGFADFFLYEIVKADTPMTEILEICKALSSSKKNTAALLKVTEAALRLKREDTALLGFQAMRNNGFEIRPHFYWPLLLNAAHNKRETDVIKLIKHIIDNEVYLDDETLQNYTIPYLSMKDPLIIVRQLQDSGVKISQLLTPLLADFLNKGNFQGAITLTDKIKGKINGDIIVKHLLHGYLVNKNVDGTAKILRNINSSSDQNGRFLAELIANDRITITNEELSSLIFAFDKNKLKICRIAAEALEPRIKRLMKSENLLKTFNRIVESGIRETDGSYYAWIPHPRDMTIEELENHLSDLSTKNMNTRGVLRKLIQAHCGKNNLKKAEEFAKIFNDKEFQWTTGMISGMFSLYAANGMIDKAEIRYKELKEKHKRFKIDDHKVIDYATALVNHKKFERALEVLNEQENIRASSETVRNCWRLLSAVSESGNSNNVKKTLALLIEKGYCEISNHVLGPLVRTHLLNGDLIGAVNEFKECARIHRKLPLQQELLRSVVKTCNDQIEAQNLLHEVFNVIKNVHGDPAANTHLFMALAAENKQKELHNFIKMPTVNQTTLDISAQRLTDENDLSALNTILKACRGVQKLQNNIIYESIVTLCSRSGDYETALDVWEKMQSDDVIPPSKFLEKLKDLLKSQRVEIPSDLLFTKSKKQR